MDRRHFLASTSAAGLAAAATPTPRAPGRPKVLIPQVPPEQLAELKAVAPGADLVICRDESEAVAQAAGADASYGFISARLVRAGRSLRWVQQASAGVEGLMGIEGTHRRG